ncbi:MAG: NifB/NifX family molybdenum-iron cluster-binding protein [Lachnospiraceae bacterium]|nr:NifB/NifX family molybdenum-iron cluster-binding protein [Lachnospiraceae bacterium]
MKTIAVTYDNGYIFQHFGRTQKFKIYEVNDSEIKDSIILNADPEGHGALAVQLIEKHIDIVICGGLGMGMLNALEGAGITVCANVDGKADDAVLAYLNGTLKYSREAHACSGHHGG